MLQWEGRGLRAGGFVGMPVRLSLASRQPLGAASLSLLGSLRSLSAFWLSSLHLLLFLSSQPLLLTHHFYPPVISAGCIPASPAQCLHQLSAVPPAADPGSLPLKAFAQTPGRIWSFLTPQATDHESLYGSGSRGSQTRPVTCRCENGGGGLTRLTPPSSCPAVTPTSGLPIPAPVELNICPDHNAGRLCLIFPKLAHRSPHFR